MAEHNVILFYAAQMFRSSHFSFLVTFGDKVMKIQKRLRNLCLHFARRDGKEGKIEKKIKN